LLSEPSGANIAPRPVATHPTESTCRRAKAFLTWFNSNFAKRHCEIFHQTRCNSSGQALDRDLVERCGRTIGTFTAASTPTSPCNGPRPSTSPHRNGVAAKRSPNAAACPHLYLAPNVPERLPRYRDDVDVAYLRATIGSLLSGRDCSACALQSPRKSR
jgi:hypothetical protein